MQEYLILGSLKPFGRGVEFRVEGFGAGYVGVDEEGIHATYLLC
jgi:hypothetical protein